MYNVSVDLTKKIQINDLYLSVLPLNYTLFLHNFAITKQKSCFFFFLLKIINPTFSLLSQPPSGLQWVVCMTECVRVWDWATLSREHVGPQRHWWGCHPQGPQCRGAGPAGVWAAGDGPRGTADLRFRGHPLFDVTKGGNCPSRFGS